MKLNIFIFILSNLFFLPVLFSMEDKESRYSDFVNFNSENNSNQPDIPLPKKESDQNFPDELPPLYPNLTGVGPSTQNDTQTDALKYDQPTDNLEDENKDKPKFESDKNNHKVLKRVVFSFIAGAIGLYLIHKIADEWEKQDQKR